MVLIAVACFILFVTIGALARMVYLQTATTNYARGYHDGYKKGYDIGYNYGLEYNSQSAYNQGYVTGKEMGSRDQLSALFAWIAAHCTYVDGYTTFKMAMTGERYSYSCDTVGRG